MTSTISSNASNIQNEMSQIYYKLMGSTSTNNADGLTKNELASLGNTCDVIDGTDIGGPNFFKALSNAFDKLDNNQDGVLTGDEVPMTKAESALCQGGVEVSYSATQSINTTLTPSPGTMSVTDTQKTLNDILDRLTKNEGHQTYSATK